MKIKREIEKCRVENESKKIGISLMMLVVIIVVIIILATVVILSVTKNNAIGNASDAVKEHDRASIQDKVAMVLASIQTKYRCSVKIEPGQINEGIEYELVNSKDKKIEGGIIGWNEKMADETGKDNSYTLEIEMPTYGNEKTEWYIDSKGEVALKIGDIIYGKKTEEMEKDETPGDITDGGKQNGSEEKPYKIRSIEDLVAFSKEVNEKGMKNKYIELEKSLDFEKESSYVDSKSKEYGDINNDGEIEELKEELLSGEGFEPICNNSSKFNNCSFDGKNNTISNLYIKREGNQKRSALFNYINASTIKNLEITGDISSNWMAAGIVVEANNNSIIENCTNNANITGVTMVGGICAYLRNSHVKECENYSNIDIVRSDWEYGGAGGIVGHCANEASVKNCTNNGKVSGNYVIGGICGTLEEGNIYKCKNAVSINLIGKKGIGGIVGYVRRSINKIENCENDGNVNLEDNSTCEGVGGVVGIIRSSGWDNEIKLDIINCCNLGNINFNTGNVAGIIGIQGIICKKNELNIFNCYNAGKITGNKKAEIISTISKSNNTETITNIENTYYAIDSGNKEIYSGTYEGNVTGLTYNDMKLQSFVDRLNEYVEKNENLVKWSYVSNGYPRL